MTCPRIVFHDEHCQGRVLFGSRISEDRKPPDRPSFAGVDRHPVPDRQRPRLRRTGGNDDAARSHDKPRRDRQEIPRVAGAAHDHGVEPSLELVHGVLDPSVDDARMLEPELSYHAREERDALPTRLDENELDLIQDDLEWDPRKARARAEIEQRAERGGEPRDEQRALARDGSSTTAGRFAKYWTPSSTGRAPTPDSGT